MRHRYVAWSALAASMVLMIATAASARQTVGTLTNIDWAHGNQGYPVIAGWAFDCETGALMTRADLVVSRHGEPSRVIASGLIRGLYRSDVYTALRPLCPSVPFYTGFHLYALEPLPPGQWTVHAIIETDIGFIVRSTTVTIAP